MGQIELPLSPKIVDSSALHKYYPSNPDGHDIVTEISGARVGAEIRMHKQLVYRLL